MNKTNLRLLQSELRKARESAKMERMSVKPPDGTFSGPKVEEWNRQVRETTRIFRETWIIERLDLCLKMIEKELAK